MIRSARFQALFIVSALLLFAACNVQPRQPEDSAQQEDQLAKPDSLLEAINKRIADEPGNYLHYLERARYFGDRERYDEAFKDIERAVTIDSTKADIYLYRGELHWFRQDVRAAYEDYKQCLRFGDNTDCLLKKAGIDIVLKNYDLALEHINTALRINDHLPEGYYLKGRLYKTTGDTTLAKSSYQTAIEVDPTYFDAYIEIGLLYAAQKHDLALEYFNSAIELRPKSIEALYNKAMFLQETSQRQPLRFLAALGCYDEILAVDSTFSAAHFNKGYIHLRYLGQYAEGIREFDAAIRIFPGYYQAYYNRGLCYEDLGNLDAAEADYRHALTLKPDYTEAAIALNELLERK